MQLLEVISTQALKNQIEAFNPETGVITYIKPTAKVKVKRGSLIVLTKSGRVIDLSKVRIYDNQGESLDQYTAVYMDLPESCEGCYAARAMSEDPFHPQGFGQYCMAMPGGHLGRRIRFDQLPVKCQKLVIHDLEGEI